MQRQLHATEILVDILDFECMAVHQRFYDFFSLELQFVPDTKIFALLWMLFKTISTKEQIF